MRSLLVSLAILLVTVALAFRAAAFTVSVADALEEGAYALGEVPSEEEIRALTEVWEEARGRISLTSPLERVEEIDAALDELAVSLYSEECLFFETARRRLIRAAKGLRENERIPPGGIP